MSRLTASGGYTVIGSGFIAQGDTDQSEGRGARREIDRFSTVEEAIEAARGRGIQGDSGYVYAFEYRLFEGGLLLTHTTEVWGRRRTPDGYYRVGWMDLREYAGDRPS